MDLDLNNAHLPDPFSGIVRLFPLPNLVVYPGIVQALHMFEPRYRKLTEDCLDSDELIAIGVFGSESDAGNEDSDADLRPVTCICKVVAHERLEDGRFNLVVVGIKRARIRRELAVEKPYQMVEVEIVEDDFGEPEDNLDTVRKELIELCESNDLLGKITEHLDIKKIIDKDLSLGLLVDLISFTGDLDCEQKQKILELANVRSRCEKLIEYLKMVDSTSDSNEFPPRFSAN